ncbi:hypothetical protein ACFYSF_25355 [Streptomyces canus]|uniref:hypothetical protein n=1 Tax=Streptomyces canus TaxID=58343 RepID=UPI0036AB6889
MEGAKPEAAAAEVAGGRPYIPRAIPLRPELPDRRTLPWIPDGRVAFWGGWGGSMAIMDLDRRMTISCVVNNMGPDVLGSPRAAA